MCACFWILQERQFSIYRNRNTVESRSSICCFSKLDCDLADLNNTQQASRHSVVNTRHDTPIPRLIRMLYFVTLKALWYLVGVSNLNATNALEWIQIWLKIQSCSCCCLKPLQHYACLLPVSSDVYSEPVGTYVVFGIC